MKIYLAARFSRRDELRTVRTKLETAGHLVTSRWLDEEVSKNVTIQECSEEYKLRCCRHDIEDVLKADCLVSFTETPECTATRGGRHVEYGLALGAYKRLILVGPRENVFHFYPATEVVDSVEELYELLGEAQ